MLVSDLEVAEPRRFIEIVGEIAASGASFAVQVRARTLHDAALLAFARAVRDAIDRAGGRERVPLVINGRFDLAVAAGADGVHLPASGAPAARVRAELGPGWMLGVSTHSPEEVRAAREAGMDYAIFGPVHRTPSKPGPGAPQGSAGLAAAIAAAADLPVLAIGGLTPDRAKAARRQGAHGVAVIRAILGADDPIAAARALSAALESAEAA
jgi:thiamine-phosphate pyrophosphorylase